jgi:MoxR-like ATPase
MIKINNKLVQLSQPYIVPRTELVGREEEMKSILAAWMGGEDVLPLSPLLLGEPGIGKNKLVYGCTCACSKELFISQGHEDVMAEDLICTVRFSDDPDRKMDYILSPLATAMVKGAVAFVDEIGKIRPRALAPLVSLLDERRYVDSNVLGERVDARPGFRFIAATNTDDLDRDQLPRFIRSRMQPVITVRDPSREEIEKIVRTRYRVVQKNGKPLFDCFWDLWKEKNGDRPPTPRDSIYIFALAINLINFEQVEQSRPLLLENQASPRTLERAHIEAAFDVFYNGGTNYGSRGNNRSLP